MSGMEQLTLFSDDAAGSLADLPRIECEHCGSNWGQGLKDWVLKNLAEEHTEVEPGICASMRHIQDLLNKLRRGEGFPYLRWTPAESANYVSGVEYSRNISWARYEVKTV